MKVLLCPINLLRRASLRKAVLRARYRQTALPGRLVRLRRREYVAPLVELDQPPNQDHRCGHFPSGRQLLFREDQHQRGDHGLSEGSISDNKLRPARIRYFTRTWYSLS